jgi:hypothetical protein
VTSDQRINSRRKLNRTLNQKSLTIFNAITKTKTKEIFHTTTVHISGAEIIDSKDLRITLENQMITQSYNNRYHGTRKVNRSVAGHQANLGAKDARRVGKEQRCVPSPQMIRKRVVDMITSSTIHLSKHKQEKNSENL